MNPEDYVSYPIALALKRAGFNELTNSFYDEAAVQQGEFEIVPTYAKYNEVCRTPGCECVSAPTLWQAQKWLREEWGIHVNVCIYSDYSTDADGKVCDRWNFWGFDLYAIASSRKITDGDGEYDSYESALSAGIAAALELIDNN